MLRRTSDICIIVLSVVFAGFMWQMNYRLAVLEKRPAARQPRAGADMGAATGTVPNQGMVIGSATAPITVVQFTDYECPFCGQFSRETLPTLYTKYIQTGKIRLVIRSLPLSMHPHADLYALAAHCAASLTPKSYEYQEALYTKTTSSPDSILVAAANQVGISPAAVSTCIKDKRFEGAIKADMAAASKLGVAGTPSFVIGPTGPDIKGRIIRGAYPLEEFVATIDSVKAPRKGIALR